MQWLNSATITRHPAWVIPLLVAALYGGTLSFGWSYDDALLIRDYSSAELSAGFSQPWSERFYRPLINYHFALQYALFSNTTWLYHGVNLLLATLLMMLYFHILRRLEFSQVQALTAVLLWLILPGNAVVVTWISAQIDLWALLLMMASWLAFMHAQQEQTKRSAWLIASCALALMAWLCKEISLSLPLILTASLLLTGKSVRSERMWRLLVPHYLLWSGYFLWRLSVLGARTVGERGFSENAWVASHPLIAWAGMAIRYFEALLTAIYPLFLMPGWLTAILLAAVVILFLRSVRDKKHILLQDYGVIRFLLAWWVIATLPNMLDASPRLLGLPAFAVAALLVTLFVRLWQAATTWRPRLALMALLYLLGQLHINGQIQACFTQPVYQSTLKYDINDRRRWPFSDLRNTRHEIRQFILKNVE